MTTSCTVAPVSVCSCEVTLSAVSKSVTSATRKATRATSEPQPDHLAARGRDGDDGRREGGGPDRGAAGADRDRGRAEHAAEQERPEHDPRGVGRRGGGRGERAGDGRDRDVAGGVEQGRHRDRPVPLAVGDPLGVRAMAGDRVAEPVADPPGHPAAGQGDAQRHRPRPARPPTWTPEPWAISQASAPTQSPSRGVPCAPASVRNQPATPSARQTRSVLAAASGAGERGQEHQRTPVAQVAPELPRRRAGAVGHQRGHCRPIFGAVGRRTSLPRRPRANRAHEWAPSGRGRYRGAAMSTPRRSSSPPLRSSAEQRRGDPGKTDAPHASPLEPAESRRLRSLLQGRPGATAPADLRAHRRPARRPARRARRHGRGLAPLAQGVAARGARGLRAPAGLDPGPAPQHRPLVGPAEGHRRRDPGHARRAREAVAPPSARCCC